jgi:hypothetical protein
MDRLRRLHPDIDAEVVNDARRNFEGLQPEDGSFVHSRGDHLDGMLDTILASIGDDAGPEFCHGQEGIIFAFCSPTKFS